MLDASMLASRPIDVLQLQRDAGNQAVASLITLQRTTVARKPAKPKPRPKPKPAELDSLIDLFNGFQELAVSIVHHKGRGLAIIKFGPNLRPEQRKLLTSVQRVLFLVTRGHNAQIKRGRARWLSHAVQLRDAVDRAKAIGGLSPKSLTAIAATIEAIGTDVVGKGLKGDDISQSSNSQPEFLSGVRDLVAVINERNYDFTTGVMPTDYKAHSAKQRAALSKVQFGGGLSPAHRKLLERLRAALIYARTPGSAKRGLAEWKAIAGDVLGTFDGAAASVDADMSGIRRLLVDIGEKFIGGSVYLEAHQAALAKVDLKDPSEALRVEKVKVIAQDLIAAKEVADKAVSLAGGGAIDTALKKVGLSSEVGEAIWEIAKNPGEIVDKFADLKKRGALGKVVTIADMGDKMLALRNAIYKVSMSAVKEFAESQGAAALKAGLQEGVERWAKVANWAGGKLAMIEKVAKVAGVIGLAVSAIKVIDAIANGNWGAALQEIASSGLSWAAAAAGTVGGAAGVATVGGIGIVIAAQVEAISGAAAMIRWCREQNVREAALDFINKCEQAANLEAKALVANLKVLADPTYTGDRGALQQQMMRDVDWWHRHLLELNELMHTKKPNAMGGQPALQKAMGRAALKVLDSMPASDWEGAAQQIKAVFAGANAMTAYVVKKYPRSKAS